MVQRRGGKETDNLAGAIRCVFFSVESATGRASGAGSWQCADAQGSRCHAFKFSLALMLSLILRMVQGPGQNGAHNQQQQAFQGSFAGELLNTWIDQEKQQRAQEAEAGNGTVSLEHTTDGTWQQPYDAKEQSYGAAGQDYCRPTQQQQLFSDGYAPMQASHGLFLPEQFDDGYLPEQHIPLGGRVESQEQAPGYVEGVQQVGCTAGFAGGSVEGSVQGSAWTDLSPHDPGSGLGAAWNASHSPLAHRADALASFLLRPHLQDLDQHSQGAAQADIYAPQPPLPRLDAAGHAPFGSDMPSRPVGFASRNPSQDRRMREERIRDWRPSMWPEI